MEEGPECRGNLTLRNEIIICVRIFKRYRNWRI